MKVYEITDIIHDDDERESIVETYLFLNREDAMNKFELICEDRINSILEDKSYDLDDDELMELNEEIREGYDLSVPSFNFYDDFSWTTIRLDEKEVN